MDDRQPIIIIKRVKKKGGGGHGGSWKVAYADFVTAMMAFFLLLWLLSMVSPEKRIALSEYFNNYSIFKETGQSFMDKDVNPFSANKIIQGGLGNKPRQRGDQSGVGKTKELTPAELEKKLKGAIEEKLKALKEQVLVDIVEGGVRIQIVDKEGSEMFRLGSAEPTERAREVLKLVSENIADLPNRIIVEGHTDAALFRGGQTTNWELSTSRASAARRELERNGIESERVARVVGYADQELYIPLNPKDPRNRRISIILFQPKI